MVRNYFGTIKVIVKVIIIASIVIAIYLVLASGKADSIVKSYASLTNTTNNSFNHNIQFLETYTRQSNDITLATALGISEDRANDILRGGTLQESGEDSFGTGSVSYGSYSDMDLRPIAQAVADAMMSAYENSGEANIYSTGNNTEYNVNYNGIEQVVRYRCCTTMVAGIHKILGTQNFLSLTSDVWVCTGWVNSHRDVNSDNMKVVGRDIFSYGDLQVGDILIRATGDLPPDNDKGHTEIVVYKDEEYVYVANGGRPDHILGCSSNGATPGYSKTVPLDNSITAFTYVLRY